MGGDTRLNLLLTHEEHKPFAGQAWYQTLTQLLAPMGVRTFEATSGQQAVDLIEHHPIHLAVVDTRLPAISGINVLQLIQKLRDQGKTSASAPGSPASPSPGSPAGPQPGTSFHLQMNLQERTSGGQRQRRIEVRFDSRPAQNKPDPAVILIAPPPEHPAQQDKQLLQEALQFNAFTVLSEPVDVNLMLEVMARALRRFHQNQWPV
jgi:CheY-like chemotaxis protein